MSWFESFMTYLHLVGLVSMGIGLVLAWREGKRPSWGGIFGWHPLWRQREDFSTAAWWFWLMGLMLVGVYLFLRFIWPRSI